MDRMLAELTPRQMDEWIAYDGVEPFGNQWLQTGVVASTVENGFLSVMSGFSQEKLADDKFAKPADFVPVMKREKKPHPKVRIDLASIDRVARMIEAK